MGSRFEEEWKSRFGEFASACDDDAGIAGWSRSGLEARVRMFQRLVPPARAGEYWLDAGCGAGTYTRALACTKASVTGVDYSLPTLHKARLRTSTLVNYAVADVRQLPFGNGRFDAALCFGVTQALSESGPAVRELARVLRPGGVLWIDGLNSQCVVHVLGTLSRKVKGKPRHLHYESPRAMISLLQDSGFEEVDFHWLPLVPGTLPRLQRALEHPSALWLLRHLPFLGGAASHAFVVRALRGRGADTHGEQR